MNRKNENTGVRKLRLAGYISEELDFEVGPAKVDQERFNVDDVRANSSNNSDIMQLYMRDISQYPLITPKREIELAKRIRRGDKRARSELITANLFFVVKLAKEYDLIGLPLLDLISEGNIGLMKAAERFDPRKGGKFSTYAVWWIKQKIKRALSNKRKTIRLPVHIVNKLSKLRKIEAALHKRIGREPTDDELAREAGMSVKDMRALRTANKPLLDLDSPLGDDGVTIGDHTPDENAEDPSAALVKLSELAELPKLLSVLSDRERVVLNERFGLNGCGKPKTLEQVGFKFCVTRERIRQIEEKALKKMRRYAKSELYRSPSLLVKKTLV